MTYRIYIAENENNFNKLITLYLKKEGWDVTSFQNISQIKKAIHERPHLWILDIKLLEMDAYEIIYEIKKENIETPIISVLSKQGEFDGVAALELGCDDYLENPFSLRELVIRSRKLLERIYNNDLVSNNRKDMLLQGYCIDKDRRIVKRNDNIIELTSKQFNLLLMFAKNQGFAFSREQILNYIWGENYYGNYRVVDDLVRRVRSQLPNLRIETIYGFGYRAVKG